MEALKLFVHTCCIRKDGTKDSLASVSVEHKITEVPRKGQTLEGYGNAVPTQYMVKFHGRWRRVKCRIFSNSGTLFIGAKHDGTAIVREYGA